MNKIYLIIMPILLFVATNVLAAKVISIKEVAKNNPKVKYFKIKDRTRLWLKRFPIASSKDSTWESPIIPEAFVALILGGKVYSRDGVILVGKSIVKELIWPWSKIKKDPSSFKIEKLPVPKYVSGRVAVLAQEGSRNYYHWMTEVLPRIALLEKSKIKYDYIYIPEQQTSNFMGETLSLFGIGSKKIISAKKSTFLVAEELLVPSFVSRSCCTPIWVSKYLRDRLLPIVKNDKSIDFKNLPRRIFISRSGASYRRIINEDEIRKGLSKKGFVSVKLEELSVKKQIALFNNADVIVAPHGAGLTNLLFAKPNTMVVEIFQAHEDDTFWYLSQALGLRHYCIKTTDFLKNGGYTDTKVSWKRLSKKIDKIMVDK